MITALVYVMFQDYPQFKKSQGEALNKNYHNIFYFDLF